MVTILALRESLLWIRWWRDRLRSATLLLSCMQDYVSSNWNIEIHIFIEIDIRGSGRSIENLQRNLAVVLRALGQFNHRLDPLKDLSFDHAAKRKPRAEPDGVSSQPF